MNTQTEEKSERRELKKFYQTLEFMRSASGDVPLTVAMTQSFLAVCLNEGKSITEIAESLGQPLSTTSRHLLDLGPRRRDRSPGMGLVEQEVDPMESRRKLYSLTDKGRRLKARIVASMED